MIAAASAQAIDKFMAVTGVGEGQTVRLYEEPTRSSAVIARIPTGTDGLPFGGFVTRASESTQPETWTRITYGNRVGWAESRFLTRDMKPRLPIYVPVGQPHPAHEFRSPREPAWCHEHTKRTSEPDRITVAYTRCNTR